MHEFGKVAVLLGGRSAERDVSLKSGAAVLKALQEQGIDAHAFDPSEQPLQNLIDDGFERVFIALHGRGGEDGVMQGALEWLGLPYTGSRVLGSALAMDKIRSKQIWQTLELPTADYRIISEPLSLQCAEQVLAQLDGKVMVKPACEGSSIGMAKAEKPQELADAIAEALKFDDKILVERWIQGQEYTVTILNGRALPAIRMQTPHEFYDYSAKYQSKSTEYFCPCGLPAEEEQALKKHALHAFEALNGAGWGRVDAMKDDEGHWYLLEANTVPGMTEKSLVPMSAKAEGIEFPQLVVQILAAATV
ncbi:D-alanine--D-alanine ligase [Echinimonas agarilytica]|uniref:D-alanine--D-alanine ligase n=1 Tax=Echinimonas agarilytica TaxID=1215918 RepID=A0AA41W4Q9_9GAMM|nr:D-alanine--D-alanine ligase [Echinimonas agarilytica]MCM2678781.1 D-alanine--D-alanine ligase [Echinimonas agarilytica]